MVLSRVPWPLEKGDKLRAFHLIEQLSKTHQVRLFCLSDVPVHPQSEEQLSRFCEAVHIHRLSRRSLAKGLFRGLFNSLPFQVNYFYSVAAQREFNRFLEAAIPDLILAQLVRTAPYTRSYALLTQGIDYMDALGAGMARMAGASPWPLSWLMRTESRRLAAYEKLIYRQFRFHWAIAESDVGAMSLPGPCAVVRNGVAPHFLSTKAKPVAGTLLFTGNMSYRPNVESARFLAQKVLPLVRSQEPNARLVLAGANPSSVVRALQSEFVEVAGWVEHLNEVYAMAEVMVAPMLVNSGLQNKLLEAMACGVPCVTTTLANHSLGATHGQHLLVADGPQAVADACLLLMRDEALRLRLATAGRAFVEERFSWQNEAQKLVAEIEVLEAAQ